MRFFKIDVEEDEMYHLKAAKEEEQEPILEHIVDTGIVLQDGVSPFDDQYYLQSGIKFSDKQEQEDYKGKKLSFILQEVGREINTTGAKAYDSTIQRCVVLMKDELEKAKEQVLNVL